MNEKRKMRYWIVVDELQDKLDILNYFIYFHSSFHSLVIQYKSTNLSIK
jgi:hypothetical protein